MKDIPKQLGKGFDQVPFSKHVVELCSPTNIIPSKHLKLMTDPSIVRLTSKYPLCRIPGEPQSISNVL